MDRKAKDMYKGLIVLFFASSALLTTSCDDQGLLKADENFSSGGLETVYVDTFSVVTSTVLMDSIPSSSKGTLIVGGYKDDLLGKITSSTYFQIGYFSAFTPETSSIYDSIGLILPYNHQSYGDTTKTMTINVSELTDAVNQRYLPPYVPNDKVSILNPTFALYNTSKVNYSNTVMASKTLATTPLKDSIFIKLPDALGMKFYSIQNNIPDVVKYQASSNFAVISNWFIESYFKGFNLSVPTNTDASIVGFNSAKVRVRLFYRKYVNDILTNTYIDFPLTNSFNQFNNISADRTGTPVATLSTAKILPSVATGNVSFVQSGVGLYTKVEFPFVKGFLKKNRYVILDAILEVPLAPDTYFGSTPPMSVLASYTTDVSNIISGGVPGNGNDVLKASVRYDKEYTTNTKYSFSMTTFFNTEIKTNAPVITPLALVSPNLFAEVNRVVIGNRFHPTNKIKLKIYYTQYGTN
ncbi:MAG: DUF4270 family protein [Bacteroidetes bacterium]|nr:DUF4270 family protein [Bacteroidota bacterium]